MIQQYLNVWIFLGHFGCKLAVNALCNKKMVPWSPLDSFRVTMCTFLCAFSLLTASSMFLRAVSSMRDPLPPTPSNLIRLWNIPNSNQHFKLLCGALMMILAAFQYKGWSNVTMVWRLWQGCKLRLMLTECTLCHHCTYYRQEFDWQQPRVLAFLMQDTHHCLHIQGCLKLKNIDHLVKIQKSRQVQTMAFHITSITSNVMNLWSFVLCRWTPGEISL